MLFLVRFPLPFVSVIILCGAIMVVKSEPSECVYKLSETVLECKKLRNLSDLQGLIKNETKLLVLRDSYILSQGKASGPSLHNSDKVNFLNIVGNEDLNIQSAALSAFPNLEIVEVTSCHWNRIKTGTFSGLGELKMLVLTSNHVKELQDSAFEGATNLEGLHLSHNNITTLPNNVFSGLSNLEVLKLSKNQIRILPVTVFRDLISLESLDLSYNSLEAIQLDLLNPLRNLEYLYLNDNQITKLLGEFKLPKLKSLSLANNKLSEFHAGVLEGCVSLTSVDLSGNQLGNLTEQPFLSLNKLMHLMLSGNGASIDSFVTLRKHTLVIV